MSDVTIKTRESEPYLVKGLITITGADDSKHTLTSENVTLCRSSVAIAVLAMLLLLLSLLPEAVLAKTTPGPPPIALRIAIRKFMNVSNRDTIDYGPNYSKVSLCPTGRTCLTKRYAYLVGVTIGDGSGAALAIGSESKQCANCYTYKVLTAGGGVMDASLIESFGISHVLAEELLRR